MKAHRGNQVRDIFVALVYTQYFQADKCRLMNLISSLDKESEILDVLSYSIASGIPVTLTRVKHCKIQNRKVTGICWKTLTTRNQIGEILGFIVIYTFVLFSSNR